MKTILDWVNEAKRVTGSDYATAKRLGVSRQMVSKMRSGATIPTNKTCERLAEIVEVSPLEIIASCEVQRDPAEKNRWVKWMGAAAILAGVVMIDSSFNSTAYASELNEPSIHYAQLVVGALILFLVYSYSSKSMYFKEM